MKNLIILLLVLTSTVSKCQNANIISPSEYNNIKINNIKLIDIRNTLGKPTAVETLLGTPNSKEIDSDGDFYRYEFNGFSIGFSAIISDGTHGKPILSGFKIINSMVNFSIKGIPISVGDNISKLGSVIYNIDTDSSKSIIYMECEGCNNFIFIEFNQSTKAVTRIGYIEQT